MQNSAFFLILAFIGSLALSACTKSAESKNQIQFLSHDFVVQTVSSEFSPIDNSIAENCLEQIRKVTCVSDIEDLEYDVNCSKDRVTPEQISALEKVVADLPPPHKKMMCALSRIQIQDNIFSMAYASFIRNERRRSIGTMIGLRAEVLKDQSVHKDLNSWKEQLNFGLSTPKDPDLKVSAQGPTVREETPQARTSYLFVFVHELNHLFDFLNQANSVAFDECVKDEKIPYLEHCKTPETSFSRLSWGDSQMNFMFDSEEAAEQNRDTEYPDLPKYWAQKFPLVNQLCFYFCKTVISPSLIKQVYQELGATDFVTSYSSSNEYEDFAEAATFWAFEHYGISYSYQIIGPDKLVYFDGATQFKSSNFKAKREWLNKFFAEDLIYTIPTTGENP